MRRFGRVGYNDHLIYQHLEEAQQVPKGTAASKKNRFHLSHEAIPGKWKTDRFSPNRLALDILW